MTATADDMTASQVRPKDCTASWFTLMYRLSIPVVPMSSLHRWPSTSFMTGCVDLGGGAHQSRDMFATRLEAK